MTYQLIDMCTGARVPVPGPWVRSDAGIDVEILALEVPPVFEPRTATMRIDNGNGTSVTVSPRRYGLHVERRHLP